MSSWTQGPSILLFGYPVCCFWSLGLLPQAQALYPYQCPKQKGGDSRGKRQSLFYIKGGRTLPKILSSSTADIFLVGQNRVTLPYSNTGKWRKASGVRPFYSGRQARKEEEGGQEKKGYPSQGPESFLCYPLQKNLLSIYSLLSHLGGISLVK